MAKRIVTKIGDVFCVNLKGGMKGYFQYIAVDRTQLTSSVIRAFKKRYNSDENPKIEDIVKDDVHFYAHTVLRAGIEFNYWHKIGKSTEIGAEEVEKVLWGYTDKEGYDWFDWPIDVDPRKNWRVWYINKKERKIGKLPKRYHDVVEYGTVIPYHYIVARMETGCYTFHSCVFDEIKRSPFPDAHSYMKLSKDNTETYFHYLGDTAIQQIILSEGKLIRLLAGQDLDLPRFHEINWYFEDFISKEEFQSIWTKYNNPE